MNLKPTRNGFIFWIAAPSGNLDPTSKSISVWNRLEYFFLMPSSGELEHFDPSVALPPKKWTKTKLCCLTIEINFCRKYFFDTIVIYFFDPEYFLIPHSCKDGKATV